MSNTKISANYSTIILSAGKSSRMGQPKYALQCPNGKSFLEQIIENFLKFGCREIVVVLNAEGFTDLSKKSDLFPKNVKFVRNDFPEYQRFYSLKLGAMALENPYPIFVHNVDNPFVCSEVLNELLQNLPNADYILPEFDGKGGHPILLSEKVVQTLRACSENSTHLRDFLTKFSAKRIPVQTSTILANLNTEEDYRTYLDGLM